MYLPVGGLPALSIDESVSGGESTPVFSGAPLDDGNVLLWLRCGRALELSGACGVMVVVLLLMTCEKGLPDPRGVVFFEVLLPPLEKVNIPIRALTISKRGQNDMDGQTGGKKT